MNRFTKEMHIHDEQIKHMNALYRKHETKSYSKTEVTHLYLIAVATWTFIITVTAYIVA